MKKVLIFALLMFLMPMVALADVVVDEDTPTQDKNKVNNPKTGTKENLLIAGSVIAIGTTIIVLKKNKNVIGKI